MEIKEIKRRIELNINNIIKHYYDEGFEWEVSFSYNGEPIKLGNKTITKER